MSRAVTAVKANGYCTTSSGVPIWRYAKEHVEGSRLVVVVHQHHAVLVKDEEHLETLGKYKCDGTWVLNKETAEEVWRLLYR